MDEHTRAASTYTPSKNLWRRIVSGVVMGLVTLGLLYAGPKPFAIFVMIIAIMMSWEWGRMVRSETVDPAFLVHALAIVCAAVLTVLGQPIFAIASLVSGAILVCLMCISGRTPITSMLGVFYVGIPTVALLWFRADPNWGFEATIYILAIVWAADIAAFAGGKTFGGYKLWPSVSPKKTWAGFLFAMIGAGVVGVVAGLFMTPAAIPILALKSVVLGAIAQCGDLAESALKRTFGVKDASDLIPGHGGFMDRMDGVVAVATAAAVFALLISQAPLAAPAGALLFAP